MLPDHLPQTIPSPTKVAFTGDMHQLLPFWPLQRLCRQPLTLFLFCLLLELPLQLLHLRTLLIELFLKTCGSSPLRVGQ